MIIDDLIGLAGQSVGDLRVKQVVAGLGFTAVALDGGGCGVAYTFRHYGDECCETLPNAGSLDRLAAREAINWARSGDLFQAAVGVAAINALLPVRDLKLETGGIFERVMAPGRTLGMVGWFGPVVQQNRPVAKAIHVFDEYGPQDEYARPQSLMPTLLPTCDTVLITGSAVVNHTLDKILSYCTNASEVVLLGPSVPLAPQVFKPRGVTILAGVIVRDIQLAMAVCAQGGGARSLKPATDQVYLHT